MSTIAQDLYADDAHSRSQNPPKSSAPEQRKKLVHAGQMHWVHWLIVSLSILLTLGAWYISKEQVAKSVEERFNREAGQVVELVKERMELYENALWGAVSMIDTNLGEITYPQWVAYSNSLQIDEVYPGINGFGVIFNIHLDQLDPYLRRERNWRPDYGIHPEHDESEYWPITYVEPADTNIKAIGLDMAFETNRYTGIQKARDNGTAQLTGPITLVQDSKKTPGFLFYTPFYRNGEKPQTVSERRENIVGVTYAPFIMYKLMQGTLASQNRHVSITISDQGELLYRDSRTSSDSDIDPDPLYTTQSVVELYGRKWSFHIASDASFREAAANSQPYFILVGGIIIDSLLLALFIFLSQANRRALNYADQMTQEMQVKTAHLEKSNEDLEQFAYIASHDLKSPLNAIHKLVGWIKEDLGDDIPDDSKKHLQLLTGRSERMNRLLDDLLSYSRVSRFGHECENLNLKLLAEDLFELIDKPDGFTVDAPDCNILLPRTPFEIVIRNMISNAVKHHDKDDGSIEISCESLPSSYQIQITDDGPGIPTELRDKALEMFQTLKSRDNVEGSGMGLALTKRIVENYGGDLWIETNGNRGTKIVINWPKSQ